MVLVYGAEGLLGREICRRLRVHNERVRALLPRKAPSSSIEALRRLNVELFIADLSELPAVAAACTGQQAVICTDPAMLPAPDGQPLDAGSVRCLIEFANALSVREFIVVTVPERFETRCALVEVREECCARLSSHNMKYVVLETGFFMETWLSPALGFDYEDGRATVFGDGTQPVAWVSCDDVAELAVRLVGVDQGSKHRIRVAAPGNMSQFELVRLFEEMRGGPMDVLPISESDLLAEHRKARNPSDRVLAAMKVEFARGCPLRADHDRIPFALASVQDYARRVTGSQAWTAGSD